MSHNSGSQSMGSSQGQESSQNAALQLQLPKCRSARPAVFWRLEPTKGEPETENHALFCGGWYIWMRLPQVSEKFASFTGPCCFGSVVNLTPCFFSRFASASISSTSNAARGIPC